METITSTETATKAFDVVSPIDGKLLATVETSTPQELHEKVLLAEVASKKWANTPIKERVQVFFNYINLLKEHREELAELVHKENGKTMGESYAEVDKSIELTEFACSMPQLISGDTLEVSKGVECKTVYAPLGVVACITPFNFPIMVPHWTLPNALVLGNAVILKPSELVPLSSLRMKELLEKAGLPENVLEIVNGGKEMVEAVCDHPTIKAVSFVGSTPVAKIVYARASKSHKKVLCLGGAKNHLFVLPDAHAAMTASNVVASMAGCAGQRCMAASVMLAVGQVDHIIEKMVEDAKKVIPGETLGPVITAAAKKRIEDYITSAVEEGATLLADGRNTTVEGKEGGWYVGPTIIDHAKPHMKVVKEEVFGPVIAIVRTATLDEAISIENHSPFGNAAAVFTQSGGLANKVVSAASAGMVGVNVGVPVPREPFSFAGWNDSKFGSGDTTGESSIEFWTQLKKITTKWNPEDQTNWMS